MDVKEDFAPLKLRFTDPIQHDYEVIRLVVLFSQQIAERSRETEMERTTVGEKAKRFITEGMLGLVDRRTTRAGRKEHTYPGPIAGYILYLKQLYPPIHYREIVRILARKFGYKTNHHTIKSFLERYQIPFQLELELTTFHEFEDAYKARWTVVRMYYEGWEKKSIAGLLKLSRHRVGRLVAAFEKDGFAGLEDKRTRPANHPHNQLTLPFLEEVLEVQEAYPRLGRFRVHGMLEQTKGEDTPSERTVGRAMAANRFFRGAPGPWPPPPERSNEESKELPYNPLHRHQYWFIDIRYLVKLNRRWVYSICIIEGYSRKILAGMASEYQDELSVLQLLHAAFIQVFNTTSHWAHREREDGLKTPVDVLGWARGRPVEPRELRGVFRHLQFPRVVNRHGLVSVQRFYIYAERGLARRRVAVWIYEDRLRIEYQQTLLARYSCAVDRRQKTLTSVSRPKLYRTPYVSPQMELFELDDKQWRKVLRRPPYAPRKSQEALARQLPLLGLEFVLLLTLR